MKNSIGSNYSVVFLILALHFLLIERAEAISGQKVLDALDNPNGVEFVEFQYRTPKLDKEGWPLYDDNNEIIYNYKSGGGDKWTVQNKLQYYTYPQSGGTCLRSTGVAASHAARIILKVYGSGTFNVKYKTSSGYGDYFNIWVDGKCISMGSGYDYGYEPGTEDWSEAEVIVPSGKAEDGSFAGTYYHEIILEYEKDESSLEDDRPEKPVKSDYDDDEWYKEDLKAYEDEIKYHNDCIWIDAGFIPITYDDETGEPISTRTVWYQEPISLIIDAGVNIEFVKSMDVFINSSAFDNGYQVRYTIDGTTPTIRSTEAFKDKPITINQSCTIKAKVFQNTVPYSPVTIAEQNFICYSVAPAPTCEWQGALSDSNKQVYTLSTSCVDCDIFYRFNEGEEKRYQKAIEITEPGILTAVVRSQKVTDSDGETLFVTVRRAPVPDVIATCNGRPFVSGQGMVAGETVTVTILPYAGGRAKVRFDAEGEWLDYNSPLVIKEPCSLWVRGEVDQMLGSETMVWRATIPDVDMSIGASNGKDIVLRSGWNLISIPIRLTASDEAKLLDRGRLFRLDGNAFVITATIEPCVGYFIFVKDKQLFPALDVKGTKASGIAARKQGWQLVGVETDVVPSENYWEWHNGRFRLASLLKPGYGYIYYNKE